MTSKLVARKQSENEQARENAVIDLVAEGAEVEIPAAMIESEVDFMFRDFGSRLTSQGMNLDLYYQFTGQDEASLKDQMKGDAEKRVRNQLVLEQVAKQEDLDVTEADLNEELEKLSQHYGRSVEELTAIFEANNNLDNLKSDIKIRKAVQLLLENTK